MNILGLWIAIIEVLMYIGTSYFIKKKFNFNNMDNMTYYWLTFTILTGIWEITYLLHQTNIIKNANNLIKNNEHVWTKKYPLSSIIPKNFSKLFYSEYSAWADREYKSKYKYLTMFIPKCLFCSLLSLISLVSYYNGSMNNFYIALGISMGNQLMNSLLYIFQYTIQIHNPNSLNYITDNFPKGTLLIKRPFILINLAWIIIPIYIVVKYLSEYQLTFVIGILSKIL